MAIESVDLLRLRSAMGAAWNEDDGLDHDGLDWPLKVCLRVVFDCETGLSADARSREVSEERKLIHGVHPARVEGLLCVSKGIAYAGNKICVCEADDFAATPTGGQCLRCGGSYHSDSLHRLLVEGKKC